MRLKVLFSPLDVRASVSAPIMTAVVLSLAVALLTYEGLVSRKNMEPVSILLVSEDEDESYETERLADLPLELEEALEAAVKASSSGSLTVESLEDIPLFAASDPATQTQGEAFVGKLLLQKQRTQEALSMLGALSEEERITSMATFDWARALSIDGQKDKAIEAYRVHVEKFPGHQLGALNYGIVLGKAGRHSEALEALQHAADISSGKLKAKALMLRGNNWLALKEFEEATLDYQRSLEYRPDSAITWRKLGNAKAHMHDLTSRDFVGDFERALALAPDSATTYLEWANALFSRGQFDDALVPYQRAQKSAPNRFDILLRRALNLYASERPSAAKGLLASLRRHASSKRRTWEVDLLEAILEGSDKDLDRLSADASRATGGDLDNYLIVLAHIKGGTLGMAEGERQAIFDSPDFGIPSRYEDARDLFRRRDYEVACTKLEALSQRAPESPLIFYYLGRCEIALNQIHNAEAHLLRARELDVNSRKITLEYVTLLRKVGKSQQAIKTLQKYLVVRPKDISTLRVLGDVQIESGRTKDAIKTYSQVFELDDTDVESGVRLVELLLEAHDFQNSLTNINLVIDSEPNNPDARVLKGKIYVQLGRVDLARTALEQAILLAPDREDIKVLLTELNENTRTD